jgi:CheY-like chemotaxis protein
MADDDEDDSMLALSAFKEAGIDGEIRFVRDGMELMEHLRNGNSLPDLILLDLNMPRKDGREALREIQSDVRLRDLKVIIFTTSKEERDMKWCSEAGASGFVTKPVMFEKWVEIMKSLPVIPVNREAKR